jgi:uncharacterized membrane protein YdjX (TVP38/TMEM64 family)
MSQRQAIRSFLQKNWPWLTAGGFIGLVLLSYFYVPVFQDFIQETWAVLMSKDEEKISHYFKSFGLWGPLLIVVLISIQMFLILFPNVLLVVVSSLAYGPVWGTIISVIGNITASSVGYGIGNTFSSKVWKLFNEQKLKKMERLLDRYGFWAVAIFHICPFISNDVISIAAGLSKMKFMKFMLATLTGAIPFTIAIAWFGKETETMMSGLYWVGGFGLAIYFLYVWMDHRKRPAEEDK